MKKSELKTGVVYAYQTSKYGTPKPVLLVDLDKTYSPGGQRYGTTPDAAPLWTENVMPDGKHIVHGYSSFSRESGYLAVGRGASSGERAEKRPIDRDYIAELRTVTPDKVLTLTHGDRRAGAIVGVLKETGVINPRFVIGEWDDVMGALDAEQELRRDLSAIAKADSDARVAAATEVVDALRALNLPGEIAQPRETKVTEFGVPVAERGPDRFSGNTKSVTLTLDQVRALLRLIPAGAAVEVEPETEDDGWTYRRPQYDTEVR